jgi:diaminohydroxyphosphoribosylaminopyrimidine deaminase/5-amino-6-(5-phosphoribosylamino)uracil reductase
MPSPMTDADLMARAIRLAERGLGAVEPNPLVGAIVLDAAGRVAGEGWHQRYGGAHAEVNAFAAAGGAARDGTLIVTLEPCCHHGKTPPCTDAVLASGVRRVVAAMSDPFPNVAGGGLAVLRAAGLDVTVGVLETEARALNAPYLHRLATGRPWVIAKWAMTLDGCLATRTGDSKWVSGPESRARVHQLRGVMDAILVGRGTVVADDPLLTARPPGPRTPLRVVLTGSGGLPDRCNLRATAGEVPVAVFTSPAGAAKLTGWAADGAEVLPLGTDPDAVLAELGRRGMTNVLVEGGAAVHAAFWAAGRVNEVWAFVAPAVAGGGLGPVGRAGVPRMADAARLTGVAVDRLGDDVLVRGRVG